MTGSGIAQTRELRLSAEAIEIPPPRGENLPGGPSDSSLLFGKDVGFIAVVICPSFPKPFLKKEYWQFGEVILKCSTGLHVKA